MDFKDKIFKFGGDVKNSAGKLAGDAFDGAKKAAEKVKINAAISKSEATIRDAYLAMGQKYEELHSNDPERVFVTYLDIIEREKANIASLNGELAAVDNATVCKKCGKYVQQGQKFCPACGAKQDDDTQFIDLNAEKVVSDSDNPEQ